MVLKEHFWYFESVLTHKFCDEIVALAKKRKLNLGSIGKYTDLKRKLNKEEIKDLKKKRNSNIVFMNDKFLYDEICPYINIANSAAKWNFEWDWCESIQFTEYKKGQFYDWHCDSHEEPYDRPDNKNVHGKLRKLSMTVSLSDPSEYSGGDLEFDFRNTDEGSQPRICEEIRKKGSIIVFPSFVWHRVTPVTKGTRHSLVCWNLGYPFR